MVIQKELTKKDLIRLVMGSWPKGGGIHVCCHFQEKGLMVFTGNQWNEDWAWSEEALEKLTEEELYDLYKELDETDFNEIYR